MTAGLPAARAAFAAGAYLRVVNWHNTPLADRGLLRAELAQYAGRFVPVRPGDLDRLVETGTWGHDRPGLLPAFYDGYRNHTTVAAPVCDELGLPAWFFPPTAFLSLPPAEQEAYADAHDIDLLDEERGQDRLAMTWDELAGIGRRHVVAAHTAHHVPARTVLTDEDVEREVVEPVRLLTALTGRPPPAFAWLFGSAHDPASPAGRAVERSGVRWLASNTAYQRIGP